MTEANPQASIDPLYLRLLSGLADMASSCTVDQTLWQSFSNDVMQAAAEIKSRPSMSREAVARIIDPRAFSPVLPGFGADAMENERQAQRPAQSAALAKAYAILALAPPSILSPALPCGGWKTIDSAPMEVELLVFMPEEIESSGRIHRAIWSKGSNGHLLFIGHQFGFDCAEPTHWMPLPPPPTGEK